MKASLPTIYNKLSWLWYLPALFMDFMICYPLLRWSIRRSRKIPFDAVTDTGIVTLQLVTLGIWCIPNYYLIEYHDTLYGNYNTDLLLPAIGVLSCVFFVLYTFQLAINTRNGHQYAIWIKFIGPIGSICLNLFKVQTKNVNLYHTFLMINYDAIFFSQGVVDMCYWK
jgi:hypothetical protein